MRGPRNATKLAVTCAQAVEVGHVPRPAPEHGATAVCPGHRGTSPEEYSTLEWLAGFKGGQRGEQRRGDHPRSGNRVLPATTITHSDQL
jgi:hypothetical protein